MAETSAPQEVAQEAFSKIVTPYLRKKLGKELADLLAIMLTTLSLQSADSAREVFVQLCGELVELHLDGYDGAFLSLVLDRNELVSLVSSFARDFDSRFGEISPLLHAGNAFDRLLAPELADVLGMELVDHLRNLYIAEIEIHVGVDDDKRFLAAMEKLADVVPLLNEAEYMDRIRCVEEVLRQQMTDNDERAAVFDGVIIEDGIEQIIISDLADILGKGPILESLIQESHDQCTGIFTDELARFSRFVKVLNGSDIILNMFGDHWAVDKEQEWIEAFRKMVTA
jgi:hypothetical protein